MTHTICIRYLFAFASFLAADDPAIPIIREVIYKNAHHVPRKELDQLSGIRPGDPLDLDANQAACERIQDYLKKRGRYWATVSLEKGNVSSDTQVIFMVTEGPIVRVRSTQFVGNQTQTTLSLQTLIAQTGHAFGMIGGFNANAIADQVNILEEHYRGLGYCGVKVNREFSFSADQSQVDVIYHIHEGTPRKEAMASPIPAPLSDDFVYYLNYRWGCLALDPLNPRKWICTLDPLHADFDVCRQFHFDALDATQVKFTAPATLKVRSCALVGDVEPMEFPSIASLVQGVPYRLKVTDRKDGADIMQATLQVLPDNVKGEAFLLANVINVEFTKEEIQQVARDGRPVVKVIYRPDSPWNAEPAVMQSNDYPDRDLIHEARKLGTVLLIVRMNHGFWTNILPPPPPTPRPVEPPFNGGSQPVGSRYVSLG